MTSLSEPTKDHHASRPLRCEARLSGLRCVLHHHLDETHKLKTGRTWLDPLREIEREGLRDDDRFDGALRRLDTGLQMSDEIDPDHEARSRRWFRTILRHLRDRGFALDLSDRCHGGAGGHSPKGPLDFSCIAQWYWDGKHPSGLEVRVETSGRQVKVEFFQNLHVSHKNGGRYDFDKIRMMPRSLQLRFALELGTIARRAVALGFTPTDGFRDEPPSPLAILHAIREAEGVRRVETDPLTEFLNKWGITRFPARGPGEWPDVGPGCSRGLSRIGEPHGCLFDADGVELKNGDVRYVRDRQGRLARVTVYQDMNCAWSAWIVPSRPVDVGGDPLPVGAGTRIYFRDWGGHSIHLSSRFPLEPRREMPGQPERVFNELTKATKARQWSRVATLARWLERHPHHPPTPSP